MFSAVVSQPESRLLSIPTEVRENILQYALPHHKHAVLDPDYERWPGPIEPCDYDGTISVLCISKQIYNEALPLLYGCNTISILEPSIHNNDPLNDLPQTALKLIIKAEICLDTGLLGLGQSQIVLTDALPALRFLKFNMWHSAWWLRTALELAYRSYNTGGFTSKLELFHSVFGDQRPRNLTHAIIDNDLIFSSRTAELYQLHVPSNIKTITLSASVAKGDAYEVATYVPAIFGEKLPAKRGIKGWRFNKDGDKDTAVVKYMVFEGEEDADMDTSA